MTVAYPVFRSGSIVKLLPKTIDSPDAVIAPDQAVCADERETRLIGMKIINSYTEYLDSAKCCLEEVVGAEKFEFDEDLSAKFLPGLVLDFPRFRFTALNFRVEARFCITICRDDRASKIWSRFMLVRTLNNKTSKVSIDEANVFYDLMASAASPVSNGILKLYERDFFDTVKTNSGAEIVHRIQIRSADNCHQKFHQTIQKLEEGESLVSLRDADDQVAIEILNLALDQSEENDSETDDEIEFVHESLDGQIGVFRQQILDGLTKYSGLVDYTIEEAEYRRKSSSEEGRAGGHAALGLTAELSGQIGLQH